MSILVVFFKLFLHNICFKLSFDHFRMFGLCLVLENVTRQCFQPCAVQGVSKFLSMPAEPAETTEAGGLTGRYLKL